MAKYSKKAQEKVEEVMHEFKEGTLKSGKGGKVKSREQAVAIGLSQARKSGAKGPKKETKKEDKQTSTIMQKSNPKKPIFKEQTQSQPGLKNRMDPLPDFEDHSQGSDRLLEKKCIVTGVDGGIGRAVAIAFAKQGADVAMIYHEREKEDAEFTANYIRNNYKRKCLTFATDISKEKNCKAAIAQIHKTFEQVDVLLNNAAVQYPTEEITQISSKQLMETFSVNIFSMFGITSAVLPYMHKGGCIINSPSVTAYRGSPGLIDYSSTKEAIVSFTRSLSTNLIEKGIRVNGVVLGPV